MAQAGADLYRETFSCSICLNILKEPVTIPCGHSYCKTCISRFWDGEAVKNSYSCPQCREVFTSRPVLVKNTMLAEVVEKINKSRCHDEPDVESYATAEDVACDFCTERKLKAFKSCSVCLASFCKKHLQPHHESAAFKRHKLVNPSEKLQEKICSRHDEVMKIFCRTDQQCICTLCSMEEHKGHDTVSAAIERTEKQRELQEGQDDIHKNIQDREKDVKLLKHQMKTINISADQTVQHSEDIFTEMISLLNRRSSELEKEVRSKQQTEVSAFQELQEKLEQEISELKKRDAELQQISTIEDDIQFVLSYSSLSELSVSTHSSFVLTHTKNCFEEVTAAVSELREHLHKVLKEDQIKVCHTVEREDVLPSELREDLHKVLKEDQIKVCHTVERVDVLPSELREDLHKVLKEDTTKVCHTVEREDVLQPSEPQSRDGFLKYSQIITLNPNTAHIELSLSKGNRKVIKMGSDEGHLPHPDRFTGWQQVLSRQSVTGRCYWEVEWTGREVCLAVVYKSISREGDGFDCGFGFNNKSWSLICTPRNYTFNHNNIRTEVPGPHSSRIGVYVDHTAGILSFYSICDTMTLLHRVNTTFTEPLYLGLWLWCGGDTAELCTL